MTEKESLEIIKSMVLKTRTNFKEQSFFYLLWGWLAMASLIIEYVLFNNASNWHWVVWPIMGVSGGLLSGIYGKKMGEKAGYSTHIDRIMMFVWIGFVIYLILILLNASRYGFNTAFILIGGLYGLGTFISGGVLKFKPLILGGIASFILVVITVIFPQLITGFNDAIIFLAASILFSYLIPGYLLKRS